MHGKIRRALLGAATLATPALVAASLVTPSSAAAAPAAPKPAAVRPQSASDRLVHICNHSNGRVQVALAENYQGDLASRGWYGIGNAECRDLWARYLYVERDGNRNYHWYISPDRRTMCVVYPGPFNVFRPDNATACSRAGGRMVSYASVPDGSGTYNWTLWP